MSWDWYERVPALQEVGGSFCRSLSSLIILLKAIRSPRVDRWMRERDVWFNFTLWRGRRKAWVIYRKVGGDEWALGIRCLRSSTMESRREGITMIRNRQILSIWMAKSTQNTILATSGRVAPPLRDASLLFSASNGLIKLPRKDGEKGTK